MRKKPDDAQRRQKIESQFMTGSLSGWLFIGIFVISGLYALVHHLFN